MAATDALGQLPIVADLLAALPVPEAAGAHAPLLEHPAPYVRWASLLSRYDLDPAEALAAARRLAEEDPDASVRASLREALRAAAPREG
jgi:HEAT repeat protein